MSAALSAAPQSRAASVLATADDRVVFGLRVALAVVMFPHGAQHALGWFGGYGLSGSSRWMAQVTGMPVSVAALACVLELVAPVALLFGAFGRVAAGWIFAMMCSAAKTHLANGFFMNWVGKPAGEGIEYHLLLLAIAATLIVRGSGAWSVDRSVRRSSACRGGARPSAGGRLSA